MTSFGERIKGLRTKAGWSQAELSTRLGVSQSRVSQLEQEDSPTDSSKRLDDLAEVFGLTREELLAGSIDTPRIPKQVVPDREGLSSLQIAAMDAFCNACRSGAISDDQALAYLNSWHGMRVLA